MANAPLLLTLLVLATSGPRQAQPPPSADPLPTLRLDDDFAYQIVDYGLGAIDVCAGRPRHVGGVFWVKVKLTNTSEHLLATPKYFSGAVVTDNWGNQYSRTYICPRGGGRYQPGESAIEMITIAARELVKDLPELRVTLDSPRLSAKVSGGTFAIQDPLHRRRDVRRGQADEGNPQELHVTVRPTTNLASENGASHGTETAATPPPTTQTAPKPAPPPAPPPTPPSVYRAGDGGVTLPRVLREVRPNYTSHAMRAKVEGVVSVEVVVRADGAVGDARVVRSLDPTFGLDQEASRPRRAGASLPGRKTASRYRSSSRSS